MRPIATAANESRFVAIGPYCHKSARIATNDFVAINPDPCSVEVLNTQEGSSPQEEALNPQGDLLHKGR